MPQRVKLLEEVVKVRVLRINGGYHLQVDAEHRPVVINPFQIRQVDLWGIKYNINEH